MHKSLIRKREDYHLDHHENTSKIEYDFPKLDERGIKRVKIKFREKALKENRREIGRISSYKDYLNLL